MRPALRRLQALKSFSPQVLERKIFRPNIGKSPKPSIIEEGWLKYWDTLRPIKLPAVSDPSKPPFRMIMPPPNVTGVLHIGHAVMLTVQDVLARYYRMNGHETVWKPGSDHAGISTQSVVERKLAERGVLKKDMSREALLSKIWEWTELHGGKIKAQIERMGVLTNKDQEYFTLEEGLSEAVKNAFVLLHEQGLIYRDTRMVNWCTSLQTALSDIEVEYVDVSSPTYIESAHFGYMWEVGYKVVGSNSGEEVVVATTRPETVFGDRAVAVHPDDERYKHLHYKLLQHPLIYSVQIPVIPDADLVDPTLGTGAVKITPAHDQNDYEFWRRHSMSSPTAKKGEKRLAIPLVQVFDRQGKMAQGTTLAGLDRLKARKETVALLERVGALKGKHDHAMRVAVCSRTHSVIEPILVPQWYLTMKTLAAKALELGKEQKLTIRPYRFQAEWEMWLENIQDWCLSRQIVWGHRIPAWEVVNPEGTVVRWIVARSEVEAREKMTEDENNGGFELRQDEDVLDTWFSSSLLPLSTAGWRGTLDEAWKNKYPLSVMESGADILFFWLARMAMLCTWFSGHIPFKEILLHPLICDANGRKMSKSEGNVLDPQMFIEGRTLNELLAQFTEERQIANTQPEATKKKAIQAIKKKEKQLKKDFPKGIAGEGADSLRMALAVYSSSKRDSVALDPKTVNMYRRMVVKLENAYKLIKLRVETENDYQSVPEALGDEMVSTLRPHEVFMLHHLRNTVATVNASIVQRDLGQGLSAIYEFFYNHYSGIYLEFAKFELLVQDGTAEQLENQKRAKYVAQFSIDVILRLLHPYAPFITEDLWQQLDPYKRLEDMSSSIIYAPFPVPACIPSIPSEDAVFSSFESLWELVEAGRKFGATELGNQTKAVKLLVGVPSSLLRVGQEYQQPLKRLMYVADVELLDRKDERLVERIKEKKPSMESGEILFVEGGRALNYVARSGDRSYQTIGL